MYTWYHSPLWRLLDWFRQRKVVREFGSQVETFGGNDGFWAAQLLAVYGRVSLEALADVLANESLYPHFRYHRFGKPKKDGTHQKDSTARHFNPP